MQFAVKDHHQRGEELPSELGFPAQRPQVVDQPEARHDRGADQERVHEPAAVAAVDDQHHRQEHAEAKRHPAHLGNGCPVHLARLRMVHPFVQPHGGSGQDGDQRNGDEHRDEECGKKNHIRGFYRHPLQRMFPF